MFLHLSVSHSVHRGNVSASVHAGITPPPRADTPMGRHLPPGQPPRQTPPFPVHAGIHTPPSQCMLGYTPPPCPVHAGIHSAQCMLG